MGRIRQKSHAAASDWRGSRLTERDERRDGEDRDAEFPRREQVLAKKSDQRRLLATVHANNSCASLPVLTPSLSPPCRADQNPVSLRTVPMAARVPSVTGVAEKQRFLGGKT